MSAPRPVRRICRGTPARLGGGIPPTKHRGMGREQRRREAEAHERVRDDEPEEMAQAVPPNSTRGAMRGHGRGRSRAHRSRLTASCAGLRPEAVYAYSERSHGRASRPICTGRTVAPTVAARWKAGQHRGIRSQHTAHSTRRSALPLRCAGAIWYNTERRQQADD